MTAEETAALPYRPGVGVMLVNPAGLVFAGQRIDSAESAWQMPQGGIDSGEPPETAALRELCEETGVTPDLVEVVARTDDWLRYDLPAELMGRLWGGRYRGQAQLWFLMRFLGSEAQIRIDTEHPEFSAWAWLVPDELPARIVPFKRDVYARVLAEFTSYLQSAPE